MTTIRWRCAVWILLASPAAWAGKELNITREHSSDPASTALIVAKKLTLGGAFSGRAATFLSAITDLSLPEGKRQPVQLTGAFSAPKFPRVSAGGYLLQVNCWQGGAVTINQYFEVRIDARPGMAYVAECAGRTPHTWSVNVQEIAQSQLGRREGAAPASQPAGSISAPASAAGVASDRNPPPPASPTPASSCESCARIGKDF